MGCNNCYEDFVCRCIPYDEQIQIQTFLPALAEGYLYRLTDKYNAIYEGDAERQPDGTLQIFVSGFPDGFFTEFSGGFKLEIFAGDYCNKISFPMIKNYDCIEFSVSAGTTQKIDLGCSFPELEAVP